MSKEIKPKVIYAACVTKDGLWSDEPIICRFTYNPYGGNNTWYDKTGNLRVDCLGMSVFSGCITFASINKREVLIWINGVIASMNIITDWINNYKGSSNK